VALTLGLGHPSQEYYVESASLNGDGGMRDRATQERSRPTTTVVVAWSAGMSELEEALGGLIPRCHEADAELIVVGPSTIAERRRLGRVCPQVRMIDAPILLSHKQLREIGAGAARGDIVVLIDDESLSTSRMARPLPALPRVELEQESQRSEGSLARWLEVVAVSGSMPPSSEPTRRRPRTFVASWRNVTTLLTELSRFRLLRTSRATRS
jgi:hypothetical protein